MRFMIDSSNYSIKKELQFTYMKLKYLLNMMRKIVSAHWPRIKYGLRNSTGFLSRKVSSEKKLGSEKNNVIRYFYRKSVWNALTRFRWMQVEWRASRSGSRSDCPFESFFALKFHTRVTIKSCWCNCEE